MPKRSRAQQGGKANVAADLPAVKTCPDTRVRMMFNKPYHITKAFEAVEGMFKMLRGKEKKDKKDKEKREAARSAEFEFTADNGFRGLRCQMMGITKTALIILHIEPENVETSLTYSKFCVPVTVVRDALNSMPDSAGIILSWLDKGDILTVETDEETTEGKQHKRKIEIRLHEPPPDEVHHFEVPDTEYKFSAEVKLAELKQAVKYADVLAADVVIVQVYRTKEQSSDGTIVEYVLFSHDGLHGKHTDVFTSTVRCQEESGNAIAKSFSGSITTSTLPPASALVECFAATYSAGILNQVLKTITGEKVDLWMGYREAVPLPLVVATHRAEHSVTPDKNVHLRYFISPCCTDEDDSHPPAPYHHEPSVFH